MGIDIYLEDEFGKKIDEIIDINETIEKILEKYGDKSFCCLGFIDLYGNTTFNRIQIIQLKKECMMVLNKSKDEEINQFLKELLRLIEKCQNKIHTYIKFDGD